LSAPGSGDDGAWESLVLEVHTPSDDGFQANIDVVNDPVFEGLTPEALQMRHTGGAIVSFIADETTLVSPEHPTLAVWVLPRRDDDRRDLSPFRVVPAALWSVENNINLGNMDWADFTRSLGRDGVFRGF
jgi:hypothetical protein